MTLIERLKKALNDARMAGLAKTQRDFAALVGSNETTISRALKEDDRYLTDSLVDKVETVMAKKIGAPEQEPQKSRGVFLPDETRALYENMSETIKIQAQIIAQMQGQLSTSVPFPAKNTYLEKRLDK